MPNHDYSCDITDPNITSTKLMGLQVNLLRNNSTQVNKTMPFSYHKCTRVRVQNSSHKKPPSIQAIYIKQFIHYKQYSHPKFAQTYVTNKYKHTTHISKKQAKPTRKSFDPHQSRHFSVAGFLLPLGLLTKPKVNIQFESPPHFYLSKGKAKKRRKAKQFYQIKN